MREVVYGVIPVRHPTSPNREYLVVHHRKGHWAFPKGHQEEGETERETALRELAEETGITEIKLLNEPRFVERYTYTQDGQAREKTVYYYLGFVEDENVELQEDEIQDYRWVPFGDALTQLTFLESRKLIHQANHYLDGV